VKIKITSDGTATGSRVVNAETGDSLEGVYQVSWQHTANGTPIANILVWNVDAEIEAEANVKAVEEVPTGSSIGPNGATPAAPPKTEQPTT
jgi:hypothetical protein